MPPDWRSAAADSVIKDAFGTPLSDGDTVTVIKDLKVKGSAQSIKVGTKVRGIRLVNGLGDHDIDCTIDGFGKMQLKSSVVKKAQRASAPADGYRVGPPLCTGRTSTPDWPLIAGLVRAMASAVSRSGASSTYTPATT